MINPYEAPQTTDPALPQPSPPLEPQFALQQGTRRCALGGKFQLAAAVSEFFGIGVLIWIQQAKQHGTTNLLNLCGWVLLTGSWLCLFTGIIVNQLGYTRFIHHLDHDPLVKIFRRCRKEIWIKIAVMLVASAVGHMFTFDHSRIVAISLCAMLMAMVIDTYFTHTRAMRLWSEHFPDPILVVVRRVYLFSGSFAAVFAFGLAAYAIQEENGPSRFLLMVLTLFIALSFAAFADFYGRLSKGLEVSESREPNAEASQ